MESLHKEWLDKIADHQAEHCFTEQGKANQDLEERRLEGLGIALSEWREWDGVALLRIAYAALEDANYSTEAGYLYERLQQIEKGEEE